ncbi:MAG: MoaD/ThiS family protein [Spirochaetes bacterium]|nr:MoaD/ThiS family protein [Spirochaetota bacterium]MBU1081981.1 MoaD/ThiS family protein [Spirochaetota bacterium]
MRIRVYLPPLADPSAVDERGFVELADGSTLGDLLGRLRVPLKRLAASFCVVNYEKAGVRRTLKDGDVVSFFSLLPGG